jgi:hypothetical protein
MVELRSGTNTGGQEPSTTEGRDPKIPENIEVTGQGEQTANQGAQVMDPSNQQGQPEVAAQGVYVGGTYPATLARAVQGTPSYRPPQFAFTTPPDLYRKSSGQLSHMRKVMDHQAQVL